METKTKLQIAYEDWFGTAKGSHVAASLTFRQELNGRRLSEIAASSALYVFARKLNRYAFGNKTKKSRGGLRLTFAAVREGDCTGVGKHLHYHAMIGVPDRFSVQEWAKKCDESWSEVRRAGCQNRFEEVVDGGWITYILKRYTKRNFDECVDLNTLFLNT